MPINNLQSMRKILVPVDFSDCGETALALGSSLPGGESAELHLLHVAQPGNLALESAKTLNERNRHAGNQLQQCLRPETEIARDVHREVREGLPHIEICRNAEQHGVDLIVMGTRGRGGVAHMILGSVAERVLRQAPCPVLVMRSTEAAEQVIDCDEPTDASQSSNVDTSRETTPAMVWTLEQSGHQWRCTCDFARLQGIQDTNFALLTSHLKRVDTAARNAASIVVSR